MSGKKRVYRLTIYTTNTRMLNRCIDNYLCEVADAAKICRPVDKHRVEIVCDDNKGFRMLSNMLGACIVDELVNDEILHLARSLRSDLNADEMEIVSINTHCALSDKIMALQDLMSWTVERYVKNNAKMNLDTFMKMNTVAFRKDIAICLSTVEFLYYLKYLINNLVDLRLDSHPDFFRNILKHKLLIHSNAAEADEQGVMRVSNGPNGFRVSNSNGYLDNDVLEWANVNGDQSPMTPEQLIAMGVLYFVPNTIVLYALPNAKKLADFINEHRYFFGDVNIEIWDKNKTVKH